MALKVKATEQMMKIGTYAGKYRYVMMPELYTALKTKESAVTIGLLHFAYCLRGITDYPPKLSYMILSGSTPRESSMPTTAFDIGPGPHM